MRLEEEEEELDESWTRDEVLGDVRLSVSIAVDREGRSTGEQFEGQHAQTPPIDRLRTFESSRGRLSKKITDEIVSGVATFDHFRRHVLDRSTEGIRSFVLQSFANR